jgi:hypothetical protein
MANPPTVLVLITEIILDDGNLPAGVTLDKLTGKHDEQVWGTTVPVLGIKATRKRSIVTKGHVHNGFGPCDSCIQYAYNERNKDNV